MGIDVSCDLILCEVGQNMNFALLMMMAAATLTQDYRTYLTGSEIANFGVAINGNLIQYDDLAPPFPLAVVKELDR